MLSLWRGEVRAPNPAKLGREVIRDYLDRSGFSRAELFGPSRNPVLSHSRHALWWLLRRDTKLSSTAIGLMFKRDHSTVLSGVKAHQRRLDAQQRELSLAQNGRS
jgi:chromosomal replication initiation ATPase DnaA